MAGDVGYDITSYAINGSAGAYLTLFGRRLSRQIQIIEDFAANGGVGQGLQYLLPDPRSTPDNPAWIGPAGSTTNPTAATAGFEVAPQTEPIILGDSLTIHQPYGSSVANGPGVTLGVGVTAATAYIMIRSASATATVVRATEFS